MLLHQAGGGTACRGLQVLLPRDPLLMVPVGGSIERGEGCRSISLNGGRKSHWPWPGGAKTSTPLI